MQMQLYRSQITIKYFAVPTVNITAVQQYTANASSTEVSTANSSIEFYMDV